MVSSPQIKLPLFLVALITLALSIEITFAREPWGATSVCNIIEEIIGPFTRMLISIGIITLLAYATCFILFKKKLFFQKPRSYIKFIGIIFLIITILVLIVSGIIDRSFTKMLMNIGEGLMISLMFLATFLIWFTPITICFNKKFYLKTTFWVITTIYIIFTFSLIFFSKKIFIYAIGPTNMEECGVLR